MTGLVLGAFTAYGAGKAALNQMTRNLAAEQPETVSRLSAAVRAWRAGLP